jgi:regulator of protease activity HflC (stomatin/prohibitin superfamily)
MSPAILAFFRSVLTPFTWWFVVAPWEQAIRVRCGKKSKKYGAGLFFKIPFVDRVYVVSVRLRLISDAGQTVMTLDGKPVSVSVAVQFSVRDVEQMFESVFNPEATIITRVQAAIAAVVSQTKLVDLTYDKISKGAVVSLPLDWGLADLDVRVTNFASVRTFRLMMHEYRTLSGLDGSMQRQDERGATR